MNQPMQLLHDTPTTHTQGRQPLKQTRIDYNVAVEPQEEGGYFAASDDINGLILEGDTLEEIERYMRGLIPDLLELGHGIMVASDDLTITKSTNLGKITYVVSHPA